MTVKHPIFDQMCLVLLLYVHSRGFSTVGPVFLTPLRFLTKSTRDTHPSTERPVLRTGYGNPYPSYKLIYLPFSLLLLLSSVLQSFPTHPVSQPYNLIINPPSCRSPPSITHNEFTPRLLPLTSPQTHTRVYNLGDRLGRGQHTELEKRT